MVSFDSRNAKYKSPFGAAEEGSAVTFRLRVPRRIRCSGAFFVITKDGDSPVYNNMFWETMDEDEDYEWWRIDYIPQSEGLFWYNFEYETSWGRMNLTKSDDSSLGVMKPDGASWQLTVYENGFTTPDWLKGGVIYQIFPDRFYCSGEPKENVPKDRFIHDSWDDRPEWRPTAEGKILNRDYFCGDLKGIEQKLDYLESLGVTCIYLNPIFEAHSNHRYNTADYRHIDPMLGTEEDFASLCESAKQRGISIILDGVFSHTGSDSPYFNREGRYDSVGAYNSKESPFYHWYSFQNWPNKYSSWWGIDTLPEVNEESPDFMEFINGENGIVRKWLKAGARGWRLDVADELPDGFLDALRDAAKAENPEAVVLGEVWEDASNKFSYGVRRRYLRGKQLDSVMNYPFAEAIMSYLRHGTSDGFFEKILNVLENYPKQVVDSLMNHIGTHDTPRALTALAGEETRGRGRNWQSEHELNSWEQERGLMLMHLAAAIQYTLPGVPSLYYGDEAGMEGYGDPFNRGTYPWGSENRGLLKWYKHLGEMRKKCPALKDGEFIPIYSKDGVIAYARKSGDESIVIAVNRKDSDETFTLDGEWKDSKFILGVQPWNGEVTLPPMCCTILGKGNWVR